MLLTVGLLGMAVVTLPFLAALLIEQRYPVSREGWGLAFAMLIPTVADLVGQLLQASMTNTWVITYLGMPLHFAVLWWAVAPSSWSRWTGMLGVLLLGSLNALHGPLDRPELLVAVMAGLAVGCAGNKKRKRG